MGNRDTGQGQPGRNGWPTGQNGGTRKEPGRDRSTDRNRACFGRGAPGLNGLQDRIIELEKLVAAQKQANSRMAGNLDRHWRRAARLAELVEEILRGRFDCPRCGRSVADLPGEGQLRAALHPSPPRPACPEGSAHPESRPTGPEPRAAAKQDTEM